MQRALRIVGIIIAVVLLILIALPFLVNVNSFRPKLESELTSGLGREVKVGNLGLSIITGSVSAEDISIADDPGFSKDPFVRAKALTVGVELMPLIFSKSLHVTDLTLDRPEISLVRSASGKWNFSSLGGKAELKPTSGITKEPSSTSLSVKKLRVKDGRVTVGRANSSRIHAYEKVDITVHDFSFTSEFPFTVSASLPGGGEVMLDGKAGPINSADAALTPLQAQLKVKKFDLAASGFVDPASGVGGWADFDGTMRSDGGTLHSNGTINLEKLKLREKASPAGRAVQLKYSLEHDLEKQGGRLRQGDVSVGKALAQMTGTYQTQGESTLLNMKVTGQGMPMDDLQALLPALGVTLPSGSSLKGGTISANLAVSGPLDKLVITGPLRLTDTKLAGFDLGSKLSGISALGGTKTGSDTSIQNLSTTARVAPEGIRTDDLNLTIPALGVLTGTGTISPDGALDYKMNASLSGGAVTGLTQIAGLGNKGAGIPFFIQGTTSKPKFVPDVKGMLGNKSSMDALTGLFKKKKTPH